MLIFIMINGYIGILRAKNDYHKGQLIAIFSGLAGIWVAGYGNQVFGQLPTGILVYLSIFFLTPTYKKHILLPLYAPRETT